jgi:hypothetical protein
MSIEVKITNMFNEGENLQVMEFESWRRLLTRSYLEKAASEIYRDYKLKKTNSGFLISGTTKGFLPNFYIEVEINKEQEKAKVRAKYHVYIGQNDAGGLSMADAYSGFRKTDEIEEIMKKYF